MLGIGILTTHLIDDEAAGKSSQISNIFFINDLSSEKIGQFTALFKPQAKCKTIISIHTPIVISGTVTLDAGDVQMDIDMSIPKNG